MGWNTNQHISANVVFDHHGARANDGGISKSQPLPHHGAGANVAECADSDVAAHQRARRHVHPSAEGHVVFHDGCGVDDAPFSHFGAGLHDARRKQLYPPSNARERRDDCARVAYADKLPTAIAQALLHIVPQRLGATAAYATDAIDKRQRQWSMCVEHAIITQYGQAAKHAPVAGWIGIREPKDPFASGQQRIGDYTRMATGADDDDRLLHGTISSFTS